MISFAAVEYFFNLFESYLSYSLHLFGRQRFQNKYKERYSLKLIGGSVRELKTKVVFTLLLLVVEARRTSLLFGAIAPDRQILVGCNYGGHQDHVSCHRKYRSLIKIIQLTFYHVLLLIAFVNLPNLMLNKNAVNSEG